jgi:riboflavin biosynthesis pyrimidine reductase
MTPSPTAASQRHALGPLETLYDAGEGVDLPLPQSLARLYGALRFPLRPERPYLVGNFVSTLDGVVSLGVPGYAGGKEISGSSEPDRMLMGILRAAADAVIVGAGTLNEGQGQALTAQNVYPPLASAYSEFRANLGKQGPPLLVIVSGSGELDASMPLFHDGGPVLVVTTGEGARRARSLDLPASVRIESAEGGAGISAGAVLEAIQAQGGPWAGSILLVEGGPHLMASFFSERLIDEQFLTLSPQLAGHDGSGKQLGLVEGATFAPERSLWGSLAVVKRGGSHLFLRYRFDARG